MFPIVSAPAILPVLPYTRAYNFPAILHQNYPWLFPYASSFPFLQNETYPVPDYPLTDKCHICQYFHTRAVLPCWNHSLQVLPALPYHGLPFSPSYQSAHLYPCYNAHPDDTLRTLRNPDCRFLPSMRLCSPNTPVCSTCHHPTFPIMPASIPVCPCHKHQAD